MSFKEQLMKLKDNWLLIVLFVFGFLCIFFFMTAVGSRGFSSPDIMSSSNSYSSKVSGTSSDESYNNYYPNQNTVLALNVLDRIIVKTASLNSIVKDFDKAETDLKSYIKSNDAIVTSKNVNTAYSKYKNGYYTINVPTDKYDALVNQLKSIGEVQSFNEKANDITGSYLNLQDIITAEKLRLESYEKLYNSTLNFNDKITLTDKMYAEKNNIRSLENQLNNQNEQIDYSQIKFTLQQERPTHANVVFATFDDLWSAFKESLKIMLYLIVYTLPFILLWFLIWWIIKLLKKN